MRWAAWLALAWAGLGCQSQVVEPVREGLVQTAVVQGEVRVVREADLIFVIDDSASMAHHQDKLAAGFPDLLARLEALDPPVSYRIAVMTTSVDERFGPCEPSLPGAADACSAAFGGTGFTCEAGACVRRFASRAGKLFAAPGNPAVLDRDVLGASQLARLFAENVRVGLDGSRHEQPLRALRLALEQGGLKDFLRPHARLVVLIAADEDDCSDSSGRLLALEQTSQGYVDNCQASSVADDDRLDSVQQWGAWLRGLRLPDGSVREVAVGAIAGLSPGSQEPGICGDAVCEQACHAQPQADRCDQQCTGALRRALCVSECQEECARYCGSQSPGWRLARTARAFGGPLASICETSFGPALSRLARVIGIPERIDLPSQPADPRALFFVVQRGGKRIDCVAGRDYTLDLQAEPPALEVIQRAACRLLPGDSWSIRYVAR